MDMESITVNGGLLDNAGSTLMNGTYSDNRSTVMNGDAGNQEGSVNHVMESARSDNPPTYADAFPPLGGGLSNAVGASTSAWGPRPKAKQAASASKPILTSSTSQVFKIPYEERKYKNLSPIVGDAERQNDLIRDVMQKTGTSIEVSVTKDQCLTIIVSGKRDQVAQAKRLIVAGLQTQASIEMAIPKEHHRYILGKGGKKLHELELLTQTRITIPRDSDIVRIVGTKEGIDRAKHEIQLVSDEQAKLAFERLNIPKMYHPFICGPENEKAKDIANATGARINIPPPSVNKDELTVAGEKDSVHQAVQIIMDIYNERKKRCQTVCIEVLKSQHRYVIGPRRSGIQDVLRKTGVSVEMPPLESDNATITLRGDSDKLGSALTMVYEKANSVVSSELSAPRWLHRFIIGRKGQNIKKITQDLDNKVHIEFDEEKDKIFIHGPPPEVQAAENLLESSIKELKNTMSYADVKVDQKWHRHIIGKNGATIGKIKNDTSTSINIPADMVRSDIIRIEGSPEGVAAAEKAIKEMAKRMDNEKSRDIIIDYKLHKNIIGQKGDKVRVIRQKFPDVQISFPDQDKKSDIVTLRGPKEDVDKCFNFLKKTVSDLVAANYRLEVPIFKRFHGNVIGRNGANIKKIKEETNTNIDIPAENSGSDVIVITGYKEKAEKAREMILAIQSELANIVASEVVIPQKLHTSMIGSGGKLIQSIMAECGDVQIRFPPEGSKSDKIVLRGAKEDVAKAEIQLKKLADEHLEHSFTAEVTAKPEHHRFLIGRGGINIRKVREKTGVRIVFPTHQDENKELITIIGKKEAVAEAKAELLSKIKDLNNIIEDSINIDPKHHKHLAARRALVLRDIADEFGGTAVSLPKDPTSSKVSIKGAKDCVEGAKKRLLELINDLESMVEIQCHIEKKYHRSLLANKGKHVQDLTSRLNVQIKFPDRRQNNNADQDTATTEEDNIIMISGKKENVEEAQNSLMALIPVSEEVNIPFENHRYIIGQKGSGIRKLNTDFDVNISVPPAEKKESIIIVTGPRQNVEEAIMAIHQRNEEIELENEDRRLRQFEMVVEVPSKYHSKLIGRKGAAIKKLRETYDVQINVPSASAASGDGREDQIRLVGYEKKCEEARAAIEAIVQELEDQVSIDVFIDSRVHSRIIGQKGRNVRKLMDRFKVDIRFPREENPDLVVISGAEENCEQCKEELLNLEEEYMEDVRERNEEKNLMSAYMAPRRNEERQQSSGYGYVVTDAPWSSQGPTEYQGSVENSSDFPTLGGGAGGANQGKSWGPGGGH